MNLLSIGNSFSQDAQAWLHPLAATTGIQLETVNLYIGGCCLELHSENLERDAVAYELEINGLSMNRQVSIAQALRMRPWDFITLQQCSHQSGIAESYEPHLELLVKALRERCPQAKLLFHETWAYEIGSEHEGFLNYNCSQTEMYKRLSQVSREAAHRHGLGLIPVGSMIQTLRSLPAFDMAQGGRSLCRDGFHLDHLYGRYAAAAQWLQTISGRLLADNSFVPLYLDRQADASLLAVIRETVDAAALVPVIVQGRSR